MRTKTLVLTAAISAAALATSMAQIFSVNAVGYVKGTVPANKLILMANPLNQPNNDLSLTLPLKDDGSQDGVLIFRFNSTAGAYRNAITWFSNGAPGQGGVWFSPDSISDPNATVVNPGEGFFFWNNTGSPIDVTFVGEVMQGSLSNPIPANGALSMRASQVPQEANLGDPTMAGTLGFPGHDGDIVYIFDLTGQTYKDPYTYFGTPGAGGVWFSFSDPTSAGPSIPVAGGFFVIKSDAAASVPWTRTFSVN